MPGPVRKLGKSRLASPRSWALAVCALLAVAVFTSPCFAGKLLTISTSSQAYEAFKDPGLDQFRKQAKAQVDVDVVTSETAVNRLSNGFSDVAAVAHRIDNRLKDQGFVEIPICKDDFAILAQVQTTVTNITEAQLRGIFSGAISNWNQLGGPDKELTVIVPSPESAAYKNFQRLVMDGHSISYDLMAAESSKVVDVIRRFPWSLTFVSQGATHGKPPGSKVVKINGLGPGDKGYPYAQTFSIVTKGKPKGLVKDFVEFVKSDETSALLKSMGMTPIHE